ncbi:MAG: c-type cytochrome domain-containing protein, partial [Planctomycetota bacterium]
MRTICFALAIITSLTAMANESLEQQVYDIFNDDCGSCHGSTNPKADLNMLRTSELVDGGYVVPKDAEASSVWERIAVTRDMPDGAPPLSEEKLAIIRKWIDEGAPSFDEQSEARPTVTLADNLSAIQDDLNRQPPSQRKYLRYFTLTHMHNNPRVSSADLEIVRAGLSKLINSLSWQFRLHIPTAIDEQQTVVRIDVRQIGWDEGGKWDLLLTKYPYGLLFDLSDNEGIRQAAQEIRELSQHRLPFVRADWFLRYASAPPLYHELLDLPGGRMADAKLEKMLGVDIERDLNEFNVHRAAFVQSNVSLHNRLVDRHVGRRTRHGVGTAYYWKSYDFASSAGRQDLTRHPLGPVFSPTDNTAFQHDGGEVVFSLPNGMQGYLIVDGQGNRLDEAPINVVVDSERKPLNSP